MVEYANHQSTLRSQTAATKIENETTRNELSHSVTNTHTPTRLCAFYCLSLRLGQLAWVESRLPCVFLYGQRLLFLSSFYYFIFYFLFFNTTHNRLQTSWPLSTLPNQRLSLSPFKSCFYTAVQFFFFFLDYLLFDFLWLCLFYLRVFKVWFFIWWAEFWAAQLTTAGTPFASFRFFPFWVRFIVIKFFFFACMCVCVFGLILVCQFGQLSLSSVKRHCDICIVLLEFGLYADAASVSHSCLFHLIFLS